jgi:nitroreductase
MNVEEAIYKRRSIRQYKEESLTPEEIEKIRAAGLKVPSAGAIRPLKIYVVTEQEVKNKLMEAAISQAAVGLAPVVYVVAADFTRMSNKYRGRGHRYIHMEAGHCGQNIALMAVSMGLVSVMIGAFNDAKVKAVLGLTTEEPLYIIPVGRPKEVL